MTSDRPPRRPRPRRPHWWWPDKERLTHADNFILDPDPDQPDDDKEPPP